MAITTRGENRALSNNERKLQILDLSVTIVLFVVACVLGKLLLEEYNTWVSFNAPNWDCGYWRAPVDESGKEEIIQ